MPLSLTDRHNFLAEPHIAALAVSAPDRGPLMAPVWYHYVPGGALWLVMNPQSRKAGLIRAVGRFSLLVQRVEPTTRYVSVEGSVGVMRPSSEDERRTLAERYLAPEKVQPYVDFAQDEHYVELLPEHWLSSDLGAP